jgi:hypothetical protein
MSTLIVKRGNDRTRDYDVLVDPRAARLRADARGRDGDVRQELAEESRGRGLPRRGDVRPAKGCFA